MLSLLDRWIDRFAKAGLVVAMLSMLILSLVNIGLRWAGMTWLWVEPFARHLVFLCAFLGAAVAVGTRQHIAIDLMSRAMEKIGGRNGKFLVSMAVDLFSTLVCLWLAYSGYLFAKMELSSGTITFLGIHTGFLAAMIPVGMLLIAYRFFYAWLCLWRGEA